MNKIMSQFLDRLAERLPVENPDDELFFLIGADSLHDLPTWREPARILELAKVIAVNRGNQPPPDLDEIEEKLGANAVERIRVVTMPGIRCICLSSATTPYSTLGAASSTFVAKSQVLNIASPRILVQRRQ